MSVGAYTFAVAQVAAVERQISLANVSSVVWDSIVVGTEENMKRGIVESVPPAYRLPVGLATNCVMFCLRNNWSKKTQGNMLPFIVCPDELH